MTFTANEEEKLFTILKLAMPFNLRELQTRDNDACMHGCRSLADAVMQC